jgi:hypothetical protein
MLVVHMRWTGFGRCRDQNGRGCGRHRRLFNDVNGAAASQQKQGAQRSGHHARLTLRQPQFCPLQEIPMEPRR